MGNTSLLKETVSGQFGGVETDTLSLEQETSRNAKKHGRILNFKFSLSVIHITY
jgi:hypothetical protein